MGKARVSGAVVAALVAAGCASTGVPFDADGYNAKVTKIGIVSVMMAHRIQKGDTRAQVYPVPQARYDAYVAGLDASFAKAFGSRYVPVEQVKQAPGYADFAQKHPSFMTFLITDGLTQKGTPMPSAPGLAGVSPYSDQLAVMSNWSDSPSTVGQTVQAAGLDAGIFIRTNFHGNQNAVFSVANGMLSYNTITVFDTAGKALFAAGTSLTDILGGWALPEVKMKYAGPFGGEDEQLTADVTEQENLKQLDKFIAEKLKVAK